MTAPIVHPADGGVCGVVGCERGADFESQTYDGKGWRISLSCVFHARPFELAAMERELAS